MNNNVTQNLEKLLTVQDVMDILRISRPTLYRMLKTGGLRPVRIGKRTLFDPVDIRGLIEEAKRGAQRLRSKRAKAHAPKEAKTARPKRKDLPVKDRTEKPKKAAKEKERDEKGEQGKLL